MLINVQGSIVVSFLCNLSYIVRISTEESLAVLFLLINVDMNK